MKFILKSRSLLKFNFKANLSPWLMLGLPFYCLYLLLISTLNLGTSVISLPFMLITFGLVPEIRDFCIKHATLGIVGAFVFLGTLSISPFAVLAAPFVALASCFGLTSYSLETMNDNTLDLFAKTKTATHNPSTPTILNTLHASQKTIKSYPTTTATLNTKERVFMTLTSLVATLFITQKKQHASPVNSLESRFAMPNFK